MTTSSTAVRPALLPGPDADPRRWLALGVMSFTVLLISLDQTVLNVALPTLVKDLHPSTSGLQWIVDSYTLTNAVLLLFGGALGDRFGRRLIFVVGAGIFGAGSLACGLVHSTDLLIGARAVMGLGAALLMPATLSIIAATFTGHERARAIGIWAGIGGIGAAAGPLLGGWLLQHFWWGSAFLINVPVAALAFVGGMVVVAESRVPKPPRLDPVGVLLSSAGLTALTYGLIVAPDKQWGSVTVIGCFIAAAVLLVAFALWDNRRESPLLDLHLFANRTFSVALGAVTAVFFAMFGVSYLLSQFIQFVQGADPLGVGLRFLPLATATLISSNTAARATARFGLRRVLFAGMTSTTAGLAIFAFIPASAGFVPVGVAFALIGLGMGFVMAPASNAIMGTLSAEKLGAGAGVRSMVQLLGGSFGVAIIGSVVVGAYRSSISQAFDGPLQQVPASVRPAITNQLGEAVGAAGQLPRGLGEATRTAAGQAFVSGMHLGALICVGVMIVATIAAAIYIPNEPAHVPGGEGNTEDIDIELAQAAAHV